MLHGRVHRQPLGRRVFSRDHDIDVMTASQAVVHDRQQAVCIGWKVDPDNLGLLVDHVVDEPRVLVREAVVVLAPHVRGEQIVQDDIFRRHGRWDVTLSHLAC